MGGLVALLVLGTGIAAAQGWISAHAVTPEPRGVPMAVPTPGGLALGLNAGTACALVLADEAGAVTASHGLEARCYARFIHEGRAATRPMQRNRSDCWARRLRGSRE